MIRAHVSGSKTKTSDSSCRRRRRADINFFTDKAGGAKERRSGNLKSNLRPMGWSCRIFAVALVYSRRRVWLAGGKCFLWLIGLIETLFRGGGGKRGF